MGRQNILITGSHRSGTTFVGKILSMSPSMSYINEPFNKKGGIEGVNCWYPYINSAKFESSRYREPIQRLLDFKAVHKIKYSGKESRIKRNIRKYIGNKKIFYYKKAKFFSGLPGKLGKRLLIKDPLAAFLSDFLAQKHNFKVLVLVRHPCAFYVSLKRLDWRFDFKDFLEQEELIEDYLKDLVPLMERKSKSFSFEAGLLWLCIYRVLEDLRKRNAGWLFVKHEDICKEPLRIFNNIFDWAGLKFSNKIKHKIRLFTEGSFVKARNNKVHQFKRNSRDVVSYWKKEVIKEETNLIRSLTSEVADKYYNRESWIC